MIRNRRVAKAAMVKEMAYYFAEIGRVLSLEELHKREVVGKKAPFSLKQIKETIGSYSTLVTMIKREYEPLLNNSKIDPLQELRSRSTEK